MSPLPLKGLLVVALEQAVAAPLASSRLADAGARVIKLERHEGDFSRSYDTYASGHSSYFMWLNRHKESCRVNLSLDIDRRLVHQMLAQADVFIQNLGPGATVRLGLGSKALRLAYPRLITCDISGYAASTPDAGRKAYDLMIQGESALASITGTQTSGPSRIGISICDISTGMTAHSSILQALLHRERTGEGSAIAVSLFDVAAEAMNIPFIAARNGGPEAERVGLAHPSIAPYGAYSCVDGALLVAVQSEREWGQFCRDILEREDLVDDPRFASNGQRVVNRASMDDIIRGIFAHMTRDQAIARLDRAKIAWGRISTLRDLMSHPSLSVATARAGDDEVTMVAGPAIFDGHRPGGGKVPGLGEHDDMLRREFATGASA